MNRNPPVIVIVDKSSRVSLRLHLLDPERKAALWQIRAALGAMCAKNRVGIREALKHLQFVREVGWPIDDAIRVVEVAHGEYINAHYGEGP